MSTLSRLRAKARRGFRISVPFVPGLIGLVLVSLGAALIYLPAGIIVGGAGLLWIDSRI